MDMKIETAVWPDNGCNPDSTSICSYLNAEAMRYVLDLVPEQYRGEVHFSCTFHWPHIKVFEEQTPDKFERDYGDQVAGFYITIPTQEDVLERVLSMFRFLGHPMIRGCWKSANKAVCECNYCKHVETRQYREWKESE